MRGQQEDQVAALLTAGRPRNVAKTAHSLSNCSQLRVQEEPPFVRTPAGQASAAVYFVDSLPATPSAPDVHILLLVPAVHPNSIKGASRKPGPRASGCGGRTLSFEPLTQA